MSDEDPSNKQLSSAVSFGGVQELEDAAESSEYYDTDGQRPSNTEEDDEVGNAILQEARKTKQNLPGVGFTFSVADIREHDRGESQSPLEHLLSSYKYVGEEEEDEDEDDDEDGDVVVRQLRFNSVSVGSEFTAEDESSQGYGDNLSLDYAEKEGSAGPLLESPRDSLDSGNQHDGEFFHNIESSQPTSRPFGSYDSGGTGTGSDGFSFMNSSEGTATTEETEEEEPPPPPPFDFDRECMIISEDEARAKLDRFARDPTRRRDPVLSYYPEPGEIPGVPPSEPDYKSDAQPVVDRCPSIESFFRLKKSIDVHFYLHPGGKMISRDCRLDATIYQLKSAIAHFVQVPADHLDFRRKRNLVADNRTLLDLGAGPKTKIKFTVEINKRIPGNYQIKMPKDKDVLEPREEVRTVTVTNEKGVQSKVQVTMQYPTEPKPKLGGYMDSRTGVRYLHAQTSTMTIDAEEWEASDQHKACQTFYEKNVYIQTTQDVGQQMEREDYYVSRARDRVIRAKKYTSWDEIEKRRTVAIITIQRYWRGWLARMERKKRLDGLIMRIQWAEKIRKGRIDQRYQIMEDEIRRQECPTRMVDIELLYRAINYWRKEQEEYVMKNRWGAERKAALAILTEMEADLLLDLERTRKRIKERGRDGMIEYQYNKMGKPKRWLGSKTDTFITMDTKERLNVRHLHHTYKDLKTPVIDDDDTEEVEAAGAAATESRAASAVPSSSRTKPKQKASFTLKERLELLGRVNEMIKGVTSRLGVMLSDLITRELTYIRIHVSKKLLDSLRKRIANCFFLLCQDPLFNPEAKRIQKVPFDYTKLRKDMVQCKGCRRMQYRDEFTIQRGTTVTTRCHTCMGLYRTAILRVDLNLYRHMLDELRKDELAAGVTNSVTFLIDAFDLQFLVEQIWHGQSALSGIDKKYLLRLCRWIREQPWSPWNCVLLTEEEAVSHLQLDNMKDAYRDTFFHKVFVKQCSAKTYFEGLAKLSIGLDDRVKEGCERYKEREKQLKLAREKFKKKAKILKFFHV